MANFAPTGITTSPAADFAINGLPITAAGTVGPVGVAAETLQSTPVSSTPPIVGEVLTYNGASWAPSTAGATTPVGTSLTQAYIWVGDAGGTAQEVPVSGDVTITDVGAVNLTNTGVSAGIYGTDSLTATIDIDSKGRIVSATSTAIDHNLLLNYDANQHIDHTAVSVTAGTGMSGGGTINATITLDLADTAVIPNTYGSASNSPAIVIDQQGRITSATDTAIDHNLLLNYDANQHIDHTTVSVTAGTGLSGGGAINATVTLDLADTAVTPGTYGSATTSAQIVIDQQGRVTSATDVAISAAGMTPLPLDNIYIGDALNVPTPQPMSGDISITTLGATTVNTIQGVDVTMVSASNNISIGNSTANNTGNNNIAIGTGAGSTTITGASNVMIGTSATTDAQDCVIVGRGSTIGNGGDATICVGRSAVAGANAFNSISMGNQSQVNASNSIGLGFICNINGSASMGLGGQTQTQAAAAMALGYNAAGNGGRSIAIGNGWGARSASAIAIGGEVGTSANTTLTANGTLPTGTINVTNALGFPASGTVYIQTVTNGVQAVAYTGTTVTSFTGCTGGVGSFFTGYSADLRGSEGIAIGAGASVGTFSIGLQAIAVGSGAAGRSTRGIAIGYQSESAGDYTVCIGGGPTIGARAGTGANCIAIGDAGSSGCSGADNIMIGQAARVFSTGAQNVLIGGQAGASTGTSNNVCIGFQSGLSMTGSVSSQICIGYRAGAGTLLKSGNVIIGTQAGEILSGAGNVGECVLVGHQAAQTATAGYQMTMVGYQAGQNSGSGSFRTYVGYQAGQAATGALNTFIGLQAGQNSSTGSGCTYVGNQAGQAATGTNNTFIGNVAGSGVSSVSNVIIIGSGAVGGGASNEATIGNSSTTSYRMYAATWTNVSDSRDKKDIKELDIGLNLIQKVRPVEFVWEMRDGGRKDTRDVGFIAQELQEAQKSAGVNIPSLVNESNPEQLSVGATMLIPVLVKAVQELSAQLEALKAKLVENGIKL